MLLHRCVRLVTASLLTLLVALPVAAAPPEFETIDFNISATAPCDGFDIIQQVTGTLKISLRTTEDGSIFQIQRYRLRETYTNAETGKAVFTPNVGINKTTVREDGSVTVVEIGLVNRIVVPGEGRIVANAGRLVLFYSSLDDPDPDIIFESGPGGELLPALCTALAA